MKRNERFEGVPYRVYVHESGRRASIHGACPWRNDAEKAQWRVETAGWTVYDKSTGTYGIGRPPFKSEQELNDWLDQTY